MTVVPDDAAALAEQLEREGEMAKRDWLFISVMVVVIVGAGAVLWALRDVLRPYSGIVMAWFTVALVAVTVAYVVKVGQQVEEMKRQSENMYRPVVTIKVNVDPVGRGFVRGELSIALRNGGTATAQNVRSWVSHPLFDGDKEYKAEALISGERDFYVLKPQEDIEGERTARDKPIVAVVEYEGIDGTEWYSRSQSTWDAGKEILVKGRVDVGVRGRYQSKG